MFSFFKYFKSESPLLVGKEILDDLHALLQHFEDDYMKDKDSKDAALDVLIEYIQSLKNNKQPK
jgi:uncharacterized protein YgfB (UPF0149 family)